jgi:DNA-binding CsgD family transcriptional regulator
MEEWPLRGRDAEVARLTDLLQDPGARGVLLTGPPGVGKSRLGLECLRIARERGMAVERISATYATSSLPLGAVILGRPVQETVAASPLEQTELVYRVASELVHQAAGRRLVLLVDDVNWLDELSSVMIHQMVVTGAAFAVLTTRTGTTAPDPIVTLWKDRIVERVAVTAVDRKFIEPLLVDALGGPVAGAAVTELAERSEGNLLYLREQVFACAEDGTLVQDAGVWRLTERRGAQPRLMELIELRLAGLDQPERDCIEVVAFGEPLELGDVLALVDEDLVRHMEFKGLLTVRADDWGGAKVLLAHPLVGEVLRAGTTVMRARQITAALATAVEARGAPSTDDLLRIATWRLICGGAEPDLMMRAAAASYARRDYAMTARLTQNAIANGGGFQARLLHAEATGFAGNGELAEAEFAALTEGTVASEQLAAVARGRLVNAYFSGDLALGLRVYRDALDSIEDPGLRADLASLRAWHVIMQEGPRGSLADTDELWSGPLEGSALLATALVRTSALARSGQVAEALRIAEMGQREQRVLAGRFDLPPAAHDFSACEALAIAGRWSEWHDRAQAGYDDALAERSASMQVYFAYQLAKVNLARGRVRSAARLAGEAIGIAHQIHDVMLLQACLPLLAEAHALAREVPAAERALAELDSRRQNPWLFSEPGVARAWVSVAKDDLVAARRTLEAEADRAASCDDLRAASLALHSLVRIGDARVVGSRLAEIGARVEGDLVPLQARHSAGVLARDGSALEKVAEEFVDLSATLLASEAYCDAAAAFTSGGSAKRATVLTEKAAVLLARCEGAQTPAGLALAEGTRLTQAERRTALLAAHGTSNREIADAELVSVRTVESRLQSVYVKLGISSRKDLGSLLGVDAELS